MVSVSSAVRASPKGSPGVPGSSQLEATVLIADTIAIGGGFLLLVLIVVVVVLIIR